jgi:hypothetical protein
MPKATLGHVGLIEMELWEIKNRGRWADHARPSDGRRDTATALTGTRWTTATGEEIGAGGDVRSRGGSSPTPTGYSP